MSTRVVVPIDERTLGRAVELGTLYGLRTVDAVHLAALDRLPCPLGLATLDARQIPAAVSRHGSRHAARALRSAGDDERRRSQTAMMRS